MAAYRFYCLDGLGHIGFAEWIEADNDDTAVAEARRRKNGALKCEVWLERRLVAELDANALVASDASRTTAAGEANS